MQILMWMRLELLKSVVKFSENIISMLKQALSFLQNDKAQNAGYPVFPLTPSIRSYQSFCISIHIISLV